MKILNALLLLIFVLTLSSCSQPSNQGNDNLSKTIQSLEGKVNELQKQLAAQELKTRISFIQISSNPLFNTPFEDFVFASDDFWENTVDVGLLECTKTCAKAAKKRRVSCAKKPDGQEKVQCYVDSSVKTRRCQKNCQTSFPPKFN